MPALPIIFAPHPVFKQTATRIDDINDDVRRIAQDMLDTLANEKAAGIGANMVGITQRIIAFDMCENGVSDPHVCINPDIISASEETQTIEEASLSFPGIEATITRPKAIDMRYTDIDGVEKTIHAEGFLAAVLQHEIDYLDGITFLDHLSKLKRDRLLKKMEKHKKTHLSTHCCSKC